MSNILIKVTKTVSYLLIGSLLLIIAMQNISVRAASVESMELHELVEAADQIVIGRCVAVKSRWASNKIYTDNEIEITENLKGNGIKRYTVTTLGGTAVHPKLNVPITMSVPGGVQFQLDEEVILFTKKNSVGQNQVVGLNQGKFKIKTDKETGKKTIPVGIKKLQHKKGVAKQAIPAEPHTETEATEETVITTREVELSEFIIEIKQHVDKQNNNKSNNKN